MPHSEPVPVPTAPPTPLWHTLEVTAVLSHLSVSPEQGLNAAEAAARLEQYGANELVEAHRRTALMILLAQFTSPLVLVLLAAAGLSAVVHDVSDAVVIGVILLLNGVIGFVQEHRADQSMKALQQLTIPTVRVRRDGAEAAIPATTLVPGDLVLLQPGDLAPADARVVTAANLRLDESALTGESEPVEKTEESLLPADAPLAERTNMLYQGTAVVYGRGEAVVVGTGMATELGAIAALLQATGDTATPLQRRLAGLGKSLALWALGLCGAIMVIGVLRGEPVREMLMTAVALAVAAIPEGLPAVVTIALALGARRMAERQALVRSLPAVEGLGAVTVICTDKTGTLTRSEMTVTHVVAGSAEWEVTGVGYSPAGEVRAANDQAKTGSDALRRMLTAGVLCNDAILRVETGEGEGGLVGDPTEGALLAVAMKAGLDPEALRAATPRLAEVPFDAESKRMATLHDRDGTPVVMAKGSPETLLAVCSQAHWDGREQALDTATREAILARVDELAARGRRVLAFAERRGEAATPLDSDLTYLGLVGMIDPPRPEAKDAVAECRAAGIRTVMITGDHRLTAETIATELGIMQPGDASLDGRELDALEPGALETRVEQVAVYARVTPQHKLRLVEALQSRGHIVAMTGDGVNDAPALRQADIGVAMGVTGTDVSREASRLVLADDNFATIVAAVREGRVIFSNMRKFLRFLLNTNLAEILTLLTALLLGWPVPLLALQILWVNLVTDGLPALALGFEPGDPDIMRRRPRDPRQGLFTGEMIRSIALNGAFMAAAVLFVLRLGQDLEHQRTIALTALALAQMANCLACRSERKLIIEIGFFANPHLIAAVSLTVVAQMAVIYVPFLQKVFQTVALSPQDLGECLAVSALVFLFVELQKIIFRHLGREPKPEGAPLS